MAPTLITVLTVDDNEAFCYTTCKSLEKFGYKTAAAHSGAETIELAKSLRPDAVVLDVNLPDFDGFEVCRRLKADPATASIPVVFLSATYHNAHARERGIEAGGVAFLFAPVEPSQLATVIQGSLHRSEASHRARNA
jgi:CheY-like chemotaxis protein